MVRIYFTTIQRSVKDNNISANWDGCSLKEEGTWAEEKKEKPKSPLLIVATVIIVGIIVKFYVV